MRAWLESVVRGRLLDVALAIGLGYAAVVLADTLADVVVGVLVQHAGSNPFGDDNARAGIFPRDLSFLNFHIGRTVIFYGDALGAALALGLVALGALVMVRRRDRILGVCPFCLARIPYDSTACAFCGSEVEPADPPVRG